MAVQVTSPQIHETGAALLMVHKTAADGTAGEPLGAIYKKDDVWYSQRFDTMEVMQHQSRNGRSIESAVNRVLASSEPGGSVDFGI